VRRIREVGDAWLDAGIVPLSTLGWQNPERIEHGYGTGAAKGLTGADLPDNDYWELWFPADWISESREQIRLWFYSISFMSMTLVGRLPYRAVLAYERVRDEHGREMHKSTGNAIEANEAFDRMGADIMRWLYFARPPDQNINFGYGPADEVKRRLLTLWNSVGFLVTYANIAGWRPEWGAEPSSEQPLDRWLVARTAALVGDAEAAYERYWTPELTRVFEAFVDDLSNWYIRRSRRRFWNGEPEALATLWWSVVQALRVAAPAMPFLADHLWRNLVARPCEGAPDSVHLAGWPEAREPDETLLAEVAEVRRVVELGRQARAQSGLKLRQPLPALAVDGATAWPKFRDDITEELRVEKIIGALPVNNVKVKPDLRKLGPKLGRDLDRVRKALEEYRFELPSGGTVHVEGFVLQPDEVLSREHEPIEPHWVFAEDDGLVVALDTTITPELKLKGRVLDLIHEVNRLRKEQGLELTDRIVLTLPQSETELLRHEGWIKEETLAVEIRTDGTELQIQKA
jgi:isoleucyl-tRNA synthetase